MTSHSNVRQTSFTAYQYIVNSGVLGVRRSQAYALLYRRGPLTAGELSRLTSTPGLWKRLGELRDLGVVREVQTRACTVTGRECIEWDVTDQMPGTNGLVAPKRQTTTAKLRAEVQRLQKLASNPCPTCGGKDLFA